MTRGRSVKVAPEEMAEVRFDLVPTSLFLSARGKKQQLADSLSKTSKSSSKLRPCFRHTRPSCNFFSSRTCPYLRQLSSAEGSAALALTELSSFQMPDASMERSTLHIVPVSLSWLFISFWRRHPEAPNLQRAYRFFTSHVPGTAAGFVCLLCMPHKTQILPLRSH